MRSSYIVPIHKGIITLPRDLQEQMSIGKDCLLYGRIADSSGVVSSIPPTSWNRAYRLIIHTAESPGTLAKVARILSEMGINFLISWSAAISTLGEGCLTSVVELPEDLASRPASEVQSLIQKSLLEEEEKDNARILSRSSLFEGEGRLDPVHLTPLGVLSAVSSRAKDKVYELNVRDWSLDLRRKTNGDKFSIYDSLKRFSHGTRALPPTRALLTPDTEERYFRVSFLPPETSLHFIEFTINVSSKSGSFSGFFQKALEVLAYYELNVYSARNVLLSKSVRSADDQEEMARFSFIVDVNGGLVEASDPVGFRRLLQKTMRAELETHAEKHDATVRVQGEGFTYSLYESSWPRCFLATNAKESHLDFACKLHRELVALGLNPVNVDITMTHAVVEDVTLLLRSCPLLISLHLPDGRNELEADREEPGRRSDKEKYAPSDWVVFEESFMRGLGKRIFRMRHETVREPAFSPGTREYVFRDATFSKEVRQLAEAVRRHMTTSNWQKNLEASAEAARQLDPALLQRDLEAEYCTKNRPMVKMGN
ncbi:MAG TPA: hypothetical protein VN493_21250 [Thermoanaerobaculia bacterium]|nr:hypothetical protein [Thermoanaerobaculia bacterium]